MLEKISSYNADTAIILGSGLGAVAEKINVEHRIPYSEILGFPLSAISGHRSELLLGTFGGKKILVLTGRSHAYEKGNAGVMRPIIQFLSDAGIKKLILTNAAGSLNADVWPGRIMMITDHINFSGMNPLIGEPGDRGFVSMTDAYDPKMIEALREVAKSEAVPLAEGTYIWFSGPSFETPAEIRAARILGADAVGMSTVPEVILGRSLGLRIAAISAITNLGAGMDGSSPSHEETKRVGAKAALAVSQLLGAFFESQPDV